MSIKKNACDLNPTTIQLLAKDGPDLLFCAGGVESKHSFLEHAVAMVVATEALVHLLARDRELFHP